MGNTFHLSQLATQGNSGVSIEEHNTPNVSITSDVLNENFIDIDNISRQYFQLMIKLNESPELRGFFSKEIFDGKSWTFLPATGEIIAENFQGATYYGPTGNNTLTRHFMTDGLVVYKVYSDEHRTVLESVVVITGPNQEDPANQEASKYLNSLDKEQKQVDIVIRWGGCGMIIGETVKLQLDPNIVWPKVEINGTSNGSEFKVAVENLANQVGWTDSQPDSGKPPIPGIGISDKNFEQGSTKVVLEIGGKVDVCKNPIVLTLPYTCSSFDVLTGITINGTEEILLYTT